MSSFVSRREIEELKGAVDTFISQDGRGASISKCSDMKIVLLGGAQVTNIIKLESLYMG
jgi:hypothetical protein